MQMFRASLFSLIGFASCIAQKPVGKGVEMSRADLAKEQAQVMTKQYDNFVRLVDEASKRRKAESLRVVKRLEAMPKYLPSLTLSATEWEGVIGTDNEEAANGLTSRLGILHERADAATRALSDEKVTMAEATKAVDSYLGSMLDLAVFVRGVDAGVASHKLAVSTVDDQAQDAKDREKSGYAIWYVPEIYKGDKAKTLRFDRLSSPTAGSLAPGYYMVWCRKPAGAPTAAPEDSMKVIVNADKSIDLAVPKS